jgi:predicted phage baseplate assembly protein
MALQYRYGGGPGGNAGANTITSLETSIPGVESVTNFRASSGGKDEESVEEAKERGPMELKTRQRAVTAEDFEFLAKQTPGVRVRRALALPLFHPDFPKCNMPGVVSVIIVPESKDTKPLPSEGMMKTVCAHLNRHRLLTNEVYVLPPEYVKVKVDAQVIAKPNADAAAVKRELNQNLNTYFHPLSGGTEGEGWEFGGDIYFSDVYKEILNTLGVQRIEDVSIYLDGEKQDDCKNIRILGNRLLYSHEHTLSVHYERD